MDEKILAPKADPKCPLSYVRTGDFWAEVFALHSIHGCENVCGAEPVPLAIFEHDPREGLPFLLLNFRNKNGEFNSVLLDINLMNVPFLPDGPIQFILSANGHPFVAIAEGGKELKPQIAEDEHFCQESDA